MVPTKEFLGRHLEEAWIALMGTTCEVVESIPRPSWCLIESIRLNNGVVHPLSEYAHDSHAEPAAGIPEYDLKTKESLAWPPPGHPQLITRLP